MQDKDRGIQHVGDIGSNSPSSEADDMRGPAAHMKHSAKGILLVPQPSDDPRDPLNWSAFKKGVTLAVVCLAAWSVLLQALANASGFFFQAELYNTTPTEITYAVSATVGGLVVGPWVWAPVARRLGKAAVIFYCMLATMCCNIWSASMTKDTQYVPFVISRLFAGIFSSAAITLGSNFITELFFLHDRGKCFALYTFSILMGAVSGATFSGYIVEKVSWTVQFWYNVGFEAAIALLMFLFVDETLWPRAEQPDIPLPPANRLSRRLATYLFTQRLTRKQTKEEVIQSITLQFLITISPVTILIGSTLMIFYGWGIAMNTFLSIFLQNPVKEGGYGFSPERNASFTFVTWFGAFVAEVYGTLIGDRLPLAICSRHGGTWKPEYRLHNTWFPLLVCMPLSTGLFGGSLYFHWNYMVLAVAVFLSNFGAVAAFPALLNYVVEAFTPKYANEVTVALNTWRSILSIAISFFLFPWADKVGINWAFGMMSFFTIMAYGSVVACMFAGPFLRKYSLVRVKSEAGIQIVEDDTKEVAA